MIKSWKNVWLENPLIPKKDDNKSEDNNDIIEIALTLCDEINISHESAEDLKRQVLDDDELSSDLSEG